MFPSTSPYALRRIYTTLANSLTALKLRPYQESCLQACIDALAAGDSRIGVSLPTGSGKTTVFVSLISRLGPPANESSARKALIIVNSIELARQSASQVENLFPHLSVEIEQGTKHKASGNADVTVATYQTLLRQERIQKFKPSDMKVIVVDEAHHAAAPSYRRILAHFDRDIRSPDADFLPPTIPHTIPIIGFSATFSRHDGLALGSVFQKIVYHEDFLNMIKDQWLCNVRFTSVKAKLNLDDVTINTRTGDFNPTSLSHVINTDTINNLVVESWLDRASTRKSTLVFCVSLAHLQSLTDKFRQKGVDARYLHAATPAPERKALINGFRQGDFAVLLNVAILTEGADIPNIDCVVLARPTRSRNVFAQMIGRGMRLSPQTGKTDCQIIDFVESTRMVSGVVSTPTLFGLDPDAVIEDKTPDELLAQAKSSDTTSPHEPQPSQDPQVPVPVDVTFTDYNDPFSLVEGVSGSPHISRLSSNAWVGCGDGLFVLECIGKGHIRIESVKSDDGDYPHFEAYYTPAVLSSDEAFALRASRFLRRRRVLTANTLDEAVRGCDTYARTKILFGGMALGLLNSAKWRQKPASQGQRDFLGKRLRPKQKVLSRRNETSETDNSHSLLTFDTSNLTMGQAANIITRLKHGALSRFERKVRRDAKVAQIAEKERSRKAREIVKVGPLHP